MGDEGVGDATDRALPADTEASSREDVGRILTTYSWLLREVAVAELGETADADLAIQRTSDRLLASEHPEMPHALGEAIVLLVDECHNIQRRRRREPPDRERARAAGIAVDPELGPIEGELAHAVNQLASENRDLLLARASGRRLVDLARLEGKASSTLRVQLSRARARVREVLEQGKHRAPALLLLVTPGLRGIRSQLRRLIGNGAATSQAPAVTAFVPLMACALLAAGDVPTPAPTLDTPPWTLPSTATMDRRLAVASSLSATVGVPVPPTKRPFSNTPTSQQTPSDSVTRSLLPLTPDSPESTDVVSVAPSPHYQQDHTAVALGLGHDCSCPVLLRTTDGGASWQSTLAAVSGAQVVLPPDYPADPRIFIGQIPGSARSDWVTSAWGEPFQPLPVPPGWLAMSGSRLLSASTSAVWSLDHGVLMPIVTYQGLDTAAVASTAGTAYVLAPAHAATLAGVITTGPTVLTCTQSGCQSVGAVPLPDVGLLAASDNTLVAASDGRVVVSHDGGATFEDVTPPSMTSDETAAALATSPGGALWAVLENPSATVLRRDARGWRAVARNGVKALAVLSDQRVIALLNTSGLLCSADGGTTWATRCPVPGA